MSRPKFNLLPSAPEAVLVSHGTLDHVGALPEFVKRNNGKYMVLMTRPVHKQARLALYELALSHRSVGSPSNVSLEDVDRCLRTTAQGGPVRLLSVGEEVRCGASTLVPHRAGRTLGGCVWRITAGEHTVVYAPDFSPRNESAVDRCVLPSEGAGGLFGRAALVITAAFPRCSDAVAAIQQASTGGDYKRLAAGAESQDRSHSSAGSAEGGSKDTKPPTLPPQPTTTTITTSRPTRHTPSPAYVPSLVRDIDLASSVRRVLRRGGDALVPLETASRGVEVLRRLHEDWDGRYSLVALGRLSKHATRYAALHLECAARDLANQFNETRKNPFALPQVRHVASVEELKNVPRPMAIVASWPSLDRGSAHRLLPAILPNPASCIFLAEPPRPGTTAAVLATLPRPAELVMLRRFRRRRTPREQEEHRAEMARARAAREAAATREAAERALQSSLNAADAEGDTGEGQAGKGAREGASSGAGSSGSGAAAGSAGAPSRGPGRYQRARLRLGVRYGVLPHEDKAPSAGDGDDYGIPADVSWFEGLPKGEEVTGRSGAEAVVAQDMSDKTAADEAALALRSEAAGGAESGAADRLDRATEAAAGEIAGDKVGGGASGQGTSGGRGGDDDGTVVDLSPMRVVARCDVALVELSGRADASSIAAILENTQAQRVAFVGGSRRSAEAAIQQMSTSGAARLQAARWLAAGESIYCAAPQLRIEAHIHPSLQRPDTAKRSGGIGLMPVEADLLVDVGLRSAGAGEKRKREVHLVPSTRPTSGRVPVLLGSRAPTVATVGRKLDRAGLVARLVNGAIHVWSRSQGNSGSASKAGSSTGTDVTSGPPLAVVRVVPYREVGRARKRIRSEARAAREALELAAAEDAAETQEAMVDEGGSGEEGTRASTTGAGARARRRPEAVKAQDKLARAAGAISREPWLAAPAALAEGEHGSLVLMGDAPPVPRSDAALVEGSAAAGEFSVVMAEGRPGPVLDQVRRVLAGMFVQG